MATQQSSTVERPQARRSLFGNYIVPSVLIGCCVYVLFSLDATGQLAILQVILGLGLVIFIHELGHFLVAKWCDVHVQAFSIGFGPPLPGCRFQRGETTYLIGCFPLGGYVKMVGEGISTKEGDSDPRSFKNKPVWQRMAIISAGVVMNVLLGFACFTIVFMTHGVERMRTVIDKVEAGSPAWDAGLMTGHVLHQIGDKGPDPAFDQYLSAVWNSRKGEKLEVSFSPRNAPRKAWTHVQIEPRRTKDDLKPLMGIVLPQKLELVPVELARVRQFPYQYTSAAAAARETDLAPGDLVVATTDPKSPSEMKELPPTAGGRTDFDELCERMRQLAGKPMSLHLRRHDSSANTEPETVVCSAGFRFGDRLVGMTDPDQKEAAYDPFLLKVLADYFDYSERLKRLIGKPLVLQLTRRGINGDDGATAVSVLVPPAYYFTLGLRMQMGNILAVRPNSPAARAGVHVDDRIVGVEVTDTRGHKLRYSAERRTDGDDVGIKQLDPVRLPEDLWGWAADRAEPGKVSLTVVRGASPGDRLTLEVPWDVSRRFTNELGGNTNWLLSIPCLGIAYQATSTIEAVEKNSPAERAGLVAGDVITEVRSRITAKRADEPAEPHRWEDVKPGHGARVFLYCQLVESKLLDLRIERDGQTRTLTAEPDATWPRDDRGLLLVPDHYQHKAKTPWEAVRLGLNETRDWILETYRNINGFLSGRLSHKLIGGPITLGQTAYAYASSSIYQFIRFLGVFSVSIAVMNFLPLPVLDGGHMVFLIYEKLRGRPAHRRVQTIAAYVGLCLLLSLMAFVVYLDLSRP